MTKVVNLLLKHFLIELIAFFILIQISFAEFSPDQKTVLFEDCTIFNDSKLYGGEICGSDGKTYANTLFLDCINHHESKDVGTWHHGKCRSGEDHCQPNPIYAPVCGSDNQTWTNFESLFCHNHIYNTSITVKKTGLCEEIDYCVRDGIDMYGINPVCASNGFTYQNIAQVKCLQKNNTNLTILHDRGCLVKIVHQLYGLGPDVCKIASRRYEWNPLCASDNQTYPNPFVFLCYKPHLNVQSNHECGTASHDACILAHTNSTRENGEYVNKDFTEEHKVCGNDGRTYNSAHHIQCQSLHNKYLYQKHTGPCAGPDDNPCSAVPEEDERFPVCGTDGVTYVSPEALWCVKRRSPERNLGSLMLVEFSCCEVAQRLDHTVKGRYQESKANLDCPGGFTRCTYSLERTRGESHEVSSIEYLKIFIANTMLVLKQ